MAHRSGQPIWSIRLCTANKDQSMNQSIIEVSDSPELLPTIIVPYKVEHNVLPWSDVSLHGRDPYKVA